MIDDLFEAAKAARANAYAPYSRFKVGAAIRSRSGRIHVGCNVENAAYPVGACAEAGPISAMVAASEERGRRSPWHRRDAGARLERCPSGCARS